MDDERRWGIDKYGKLLYKTMSGPFPLSDWAPPLRSTNPTAMLDCDAF